MPEFYPLKRWPTFRIYLGVQDTIASSTKNPSTQPITQTVRFLNMDAFLSPCTSSVVPHSGVRRAGDPRQALGDDQGT
jgi:hypothetical protein